MTNEITIGLYNIKYDGFFIKDKNLKQVLFLFGLICM